jgi:hypothetical protein
LRKTLQRRGPGLNNGLAGVTHSEGAETQERKRINAAVGEQEMELIIVGMGLLGGAWVCLF